MLAGVAIDPAHHGGQGCGDPMATRTDRKLAKEAEKDCCLVCP